MWKHRESHLVDLHKTDPQVEKQPTLHTRDAKPIYPGCEFDVFQTTQPKEDHAPLYSVEKVMPKQVEPYQPENVHAQPKQVIHTGIRPPIAHVFLQPTASIHTPIANMFLEKKSNEDSVDLEYA
ncbi:hypothetical protein BD560DRAFT_437848 [Blakeslea trispora]|nr:hypothetical protein BD560DRAFT_437848 [Blakeslea trispora]